MPSRALRVRSASAASSSTEGSTAPHREHVRGLYGVGLIESVTEHQAVEGEREGSGWPRDRGTHGALYPPHGHGKGRTHGRGAGKLHA